MRDLNRWSLGFGLLLLCCAPARADTGKVIPIATTSDRTGGSVGTFQIAQADGEPQWRIERRHRFDLARLQAIEARNERDQEDYQARRLEQRRDEENADRRRTEDLRVLAEKKREEARQQEIARLEGERIEREKLAQQEAEKKRFAEAEAADEARRKDDETKKLAKAEQDRLERERIEREKLAQQEAEKKRLADAKAADEARRKDDETKKLAKAEQDRLERERVEREKLAQQEAEKKRLADAKAADEARRKDDETKKLAKAEQDRLERERVEREKVAQQEAEKKRLADAKAADGSRRKDEDARRLAEAEQARSEQTRIERERAEREKSDQERTRLALAQPVPPLAGSAGQTDASQGSGGLGPSVGSLYKEEVSGFTEEQKRIARQRLERGRAEKKELSVPDGLDAGPEKDPSATDPSSDGKNAQIAALPPSSFDAPSPGVSHETVRVGQEQLKRLGCYNGPANGLMTNDTAIGLETAEKSLPEDKRRGLRPLSDDVLGFLGQQPEKLCTGKTRCGPGQAKQGTTCIAALPKAAPRNDDDEDDKPKRKGRLQPPPSLRQPQVQRQAPAPPVARSPAPPQAPAATPRPSVHISM